MQRNWDHSTSGGYIGTTVGLHSKAHCQQSISWVAVKELKVKYYIGGTLLFTIYTHYGNLT